MKFLPLVLCACLSSQAAILIEDVTVIDVLTGSAHAHRNVLIKGDRIAAVGAEIPKAARVINGRGKFLIPGLWNMHVHLTADPQQLREFLARGVTGVEDMGSDFSRVSAERDAVESGKAFGPHILTSGPAVGDRVSDAAFPLLAAPDPRAARTVFDRLWDLNVDFIKVQPDLSRDSYLAIAEQARHWHLRIEGAVPTSMSAWDALEAHQNSIETLHSVRKSVSTDGEAIQFFEQCATAGIRIEPMLAESHRATPEERIDLDRLVALSTRTKIEVLAGSGEHAAIQDELEQLVAAGMTNEEALRAATLAPARFLDSEDSMGAIEPGRLADLVLLYANPLAEIANTRKIAAVFSRGKYFPRSELNAMLR